MRFENDEYDVGDSEAKVSRGKLTASHIIASNSLDGDSSTLWVRVHPNTSPIPHVLFINIEVGESSMRTDDLSSCSRQHHVLDTEEMHVCSPENETFTEECGEDVSVNEFFA